MYPNSNSTKALKEIYLKGDKISSKEISQNTGIKITNIARDTNFCLGKGLLKKERINGETLYWIPKAQIGEVRRKLIRMAVLKKSESNAT
jgi:hypothetical protein